MKVLQKISQAISSAPNIDVGLHTVVENICEALQADASSIFICDDVKGEYLLRASYGIDIEQNTRVGIRYGNGLIGLVAEREEPINIEDAKAHENYFKHPKFKEEDYNAFLGIPIIEQGELLGVLVVQQKAAKFFSEENEAFCVTLAIQLAPTIARAKSRGFLGKKTHSRRKKSLAAILEGVSGAQGIAIGTAVMLYPLADLEAVPEKNITNVDVEIENFEEALKASRDEMQEIQSRAKVTLSAAENAIFDAYLRILDSRSIINEVLDLIKSGQWAQGALKTVIKKHIAHFDSLEDQYLRERSADFRDLGRRVLSHLQSTERKKYIFPKDCILVSDEVSATTLIEVPQDCLRGVISGSGSGNSHVAILARALGLPTVMGVTGTPLEQIANQECIVDGYNGQIYLSPTAAIKKEYRVFIEEERELDEQLKSQRTLVAETTDGHVLSLFINTGLAVEGGLSLSVGAEGVGLYRTELPFMIRDRFPSEEEQRIMYRQLLNTFNPRPVVMRTLDIGGDKALPYFYIKEENPFLGWRGIRVTLDHPEIFLQQLRAMLQASDKLKNLSLLLPMISSVGEVEASLRLINQAFNEVVQEGFEVQKPKIGLMIEVPAAAYQAFELAKRVDFLSVGTNDLIQYLLAVDRNNPRVATLYDGFHPAVLRALLQIVKAGHKAGKPVSICGELAGDPVAVIVLLAMGFDTLSMNARSLPRVKWVIRNFSLKYSKELLNNILKMDDPKEIRLQLEVTLEEAGLGGLIHAGR